VKSLDSDGCVQQEVLRPCRSFAMKLSILTIFKEGCSATRPTPVDHSLSAISHASHSRRASRSSQTWKQSTTHGGEDA
jgi:hypothetical protein